MFSKRIINRAVNRHIKLNAMQIIALAFLGIILLGAALLAMPIASRNGISCGFRDALFTATSATCVTGLVLFDTWTQFSGFGQAVILCLIEIGGLGFMSAASIVMFLFKRKIGIRRRMIMAQAVGVDDMGRIVQLQKLIISGSLLIQALGAFVLFLRLYKQFGVFNAIKLGVFHSVSAFCNAGFDIMGFLTPDKSVSYFVNDIVVNITLMFLIIVGGLGFFVWDEVLRFFKTRKLSIYTKLVLTTTAVLIVSGTVVVAVLEWNNPNTIGEFSTFQKILASLFQSVTTRTAGFYTIDQSAFYEPTRAFSCILMIIGGSSGSTAGGVKTVTFILIILFLWNKSRGKQDICISRRRVPEKQLFNALAIFGIVMFLAFFGAVFISATSPVTFLDALFEAVSALATVGLTAGATTKLSVASQFLIMIYMYFGRVGILTIIMGLLSNNTSEGKVRYAETSIFVG